MHTIKCTLRIEKHSGLISLFYFDEYRDMVAYNFAEGHCSATYNYYRADTVAAHIHADEADYIRARAAYARAYAGAPEPIKLYFVKRITREDNLA